MFKCVDLEIGYKDKRVLSKINYTFSDSTLILGDNGTGKSTLVKTLVGLKNEMSGLIVRMPTDQISYISSENAGFFPNLTGRENIEIYCDQLLYGTEFLDVLNTVSDKSSTGMKQILKILISLNQNRVMHIWDEPFRSISEANKLKLLDIISNLPSCKKFIVVDHLPDSWSKLNFKKLLISEKRINEI